MENECSEESFIETLASTDKLPISCFVALAAVRSERFLITDMAYVWHTHFIFCFPSGEIFLNLF